MHRGLADGFSCARKIEVIQRFQIEDLAAQDKSGVVFRALDLETNVVVAVRRFFPFGADGGGLNGEEQAAYDIAVGRLAGLHHPGLRAVLCGSCDPIDGMPFIATEWIEGKSLQSFIERQPLTPADAISLLTRALDICELLSRVLAEEGIWVETDVQTIIVGSDETGRGVTFWISPLRWLSRNEDEHSLDSIVTLTEEIMGWQGQVVGDNAGRGLGGWLKWLRSASKSTSLGEAREMLAAATGMEPPTPTKSLVRQAMARPAVPIKSLRVRRKKSINGTVVAIVLLFFIAAGLGAWAVYRKDPHEPKTGGGLAELASQLAKENGAKKPAKAAAPEDAKGLSPEMREVAAAMNETAEPRKTVEVKAAPAPVEAQLKPGHIFAHDDPRLIEQDTREVSVEGVFREIGYSQSKSTLYLLFSENSQRDDTRGAILVKDAGPDLGESALKPLIGKKIRLSGVLDVKTVKGLTRPDVVITNRAAIQVVP